MALQPGDKLNKGKYTIQEKLKTGRFCITYLATVNSGASKEKKRNFLGIFNPLKQEQPPNQKPEKAVIKTLYFLLTGEVPPNPQKRPKEKLVAPKKLNPNLSDAVNKAIIQGMELDWEKRPQTMAEWLTLLPLPAVEKEPESPNLEPEDLKLSKQQILIGIVGLFLGVLTLLATLYGSEIKEQIEKFFPSPSPTPTPVESPFQE